MVFMDLILSSYGIQPKGSGTVGKDLKNSTKTKTCADDDQACKDDWQRLLERGMALDSIDIDGEDGQRWINLHDDIMRQSKVDQTISRFQMLWTLYKATPLWLKVLMSVMIIIFVLIGFIPGLMILVELLSNKIALFKLGFLCAFVFLVFVGFAMLPI